MCGVTTGVSVVSVCGDNKIMRIITTHHTSSQPLSLWCVMRDELESHHGYQATPGWAVLG